MYQGLIGLGIFFIIGNLFYYTKLFAGGDAKLMIALGPILPISYSFNNNLKIFLIFIFVFLCVGALYGLIFSFIFAVRNFKKFRKEFCKKFLENKRKINLFSFISVLLLIFGFWNELFFWLGLLSLFSVYLYLYAKSIDDGFMIKKISVKKLREGDWLVDDVKIGKNKIKARWSGLELEEIELLRKNKKFVEIREGIAFAPVFLIGYLINLGIWFFGLI